MLHLALLASPSKIPISSCHPVGSVRYPTFRSTRHYTFAGKVLTVNCDVETNATNGVILAQGWRQNGYVLHLVAGKPTFRVRQSGRLYSIVAPEAPHVSCSLHERLEKDGNMTPSGGGITVTTVGAYQVPNALEGKVENVKVTAE